MATTKTKIAEQVLRRLRKYSQDSEVDERELMLATHQTLSSLIRNRYYETKNMDVQEVSDGLYYRLKDLAVSKDDRDVYSITIPSTTVELPFGTEIKRCGTKKGRGYVHVKMGFSDLYDGLASEQLEGNVGFHKSGNSIEFVNMTDKNAPKTVDLHIVLPFEALGEDDPINIPADLLEQTIEILFQKFNNTLQQPADQTSNATDNP